MYTILKHDQRSMYAIVNQDQGSMYAIVNQDQGSMYFYCNHCCLLYMQLTLKKKSSKKSPYVKVEG